MCNRKQIVFIRATDGWKDKKNGNNIFWEQEKIILKNCIYVTTNIFVTL